MVGDGDRAQFYRDRALEVRAAAEACRHREIREQLYEIAERYEALARRTAPPPGAA